MVDCTLDKDSKQWVNHQVRDICIQHYVIGERRSPGVGRRPPLASQHLGTAHPGGWGLTTQLGALGGDGTPGGWGLTPVKPPVRGTF